MKRERKEKYLTMLMKVYEAFKPVDAPIKIKLILALLAIVLSVLFTYIKILLR